jgi:hypothetical protein
MNYKSRKEAFIAYINWVLRKITGIPTPGKTVKE